MEDKNWTSPGPGISASTTGTSWLWDPALNKGTAFTEEERDTLALRGLLPPKVQTLEEQVLMVQWSLRRKQNDLERYILLSSLKEVNETLFHRVLQDNIEDLMPIILSPTIGQASFGNDNILQRSPGVFISSNHKGRIADLLGNWPSKDVGILLVTDGERIQGLGDLGANAMRALAGKLALYTTCAGMPPSVGLPISIDVGTGNETLLNDPFYDGLRQPRLRGEAYYDLIEELVTVSQRVFPGAVMQFEGFGSANALRLPHKYRGQICCLNDIQGLAAVILAGFYSALSITQSEFERQKILFLGTGNAGLGIGDLIVSAFLNEGLSLEEALKRCWFIDSKGLVVNSRGDLSEHKRSYAHDHPFLPDLLYAIEVIKPTAIIGVSGKPRMFTPQVLQAMARLNEKPIIFSLSRPPCNAECTAEEAYVWTEGRALFASASPFYPVTIGGKTITPAHGSSLYILPGVGMGALASGARTVTDEMLIAAAKALAQVVSDADLEFGQIYPPMRRIREVSIAVAIATADRAYQLGIASKPKPGDLRKYIDSLMYEPRYQMHPKTSMIPKSSSLR